MHCNGQCQLDKKMHKMDHQQQDQNGKTELTIPVYLVAQMMTLHRARTSSNQIKRPSYFPKFLIQEQTSGLFRPPQIHPPL